MKVDTYQKILIAASDCFSNKGFNATSIGDITKSAGISQGALYTHFKSKNDLIIAIVNDEMKTTLATYAQSYEGSALERIIQLVTNCIMKAGYPTEPRLWTEIIAQSARIPEINRCFVAADRAMRDAIKRILLDGVEHNEFQNIDAEEISIILFGLMDGLISRRAINPDFLIEKQLISFRDILTRLVNYRH